MRSRIQHCRLMASIATMSLVAVATGQAVAADLPPGNAGTAPMETYPSPATLGYDSAKPWQGFHVGVLGSYDMLTPNVALGAGKPMKAPAKGLYWGALAGMDLQIGNIVVGAEVDTTFGNTTGRAPGVDVRMNQFSTFRGRAGYAVANVLAYGTAGFAVADVTVATREWGENSGLAKGFTYGGGLETKITDNISLRGEYLYTMLDSQVYDMPRKPNWVRSKTNDFHTFRAAITYQLPVF